MLQKELVLLRLPGRLNYPLFINYLITFEVTDSTEPIKGALFSQTLRGIFVWNSLHIIA